ncbi:MAG: ATP cone domain-containing protein [Candidatus Micrarchaeaceae archaeon]
MRVKKKDGSEEEFLKEKITVALVKNGTDAAAAREISSAIEKKFSGKAMVTSDEIRNEVLQRLQGKDAARYNAWLAYEKRKR